MLRGLKCQIVGQIEFVILCVVRPFRLDANV